MDAKDTSSEQVLEQVEMVAPPDKATLNVAEDGQASKVSSKLLLHGLGISFCYFSTLVHLIGSGVLSQQIVAVVGGADKVTWITAVITFHSIVIGPAMCRAADFWGRKWFLVFSLACGVVGCIVVSRARTIGAVIAGQAVAGQAQVSQSLTIAIASEIFPRKHRGWAQALVNTPAGVAALMALYVSGVVCKNSPEGFRTYWYFTAAVYFAPMCTTLFFYNPPARQEQYLTLREKIYRLDIPGCSLLALALLSICLALSWSQNPYGWTNAHILVPFIAGWLIAACLAVYATWYRKDGFFHHGLYRGSKNYLIVQIILVSEGVAVICANNYLAYQLFAMYGLGSWQIAVMFNIAWYAFLVWSPLSGWFITRTRRAKAATLVSLGCFAIYYACMASTTLQSKTNIWGYNIFLGFGLGGAVLGLNTIALLSIPPELIAPATGLLIATRTFGAAMGLVIFSAVFNHTLSTESSSAISKAALAAGLPASSLPGFVPALLSGNSAALAKIPDATKDVIQASGLALKHVYNHAFRNCYATAVAFVVLAMLTLLLAKDPKDQYTETVDAPLLPEQEQEQAKTERSAA